MDANVKDRTPIARDVLAVILAFLKQNGVFPDSPFLQYVNSLGIDRTPQNYSSGNESALQSQPSSTSRQ